MKGEIGIEFYILLALAIIMAILVFSFFPDIKKMALGNFILGKSFDSLTVSEQNSVADTFNQFANNLENCQKNTKICMCANVIPNYQVVFVKDGKFIAINIEQENDKFILNMTFSGRQAMTREIPGSLYIAKEGKEMVFKPDVLWGIRMGDSANLISEKKSITFDGKPKLVISSKDYGLVKQEIGSPNIYKSGSGMMLLADDFKAELC